jgi:hypothetical protein
MPIRHALTVPDRPPGDLPRALRAIARRAATPLCAALALACAMHAGAHADTVLFRVNCGGPALAALDGGPAWSADPAGGASPYVNAGAAGDWTFPSSQPMGPPHVSVPATVPPALFDDERWDPASAPEMLWEFPVANGDYRVNVLLAEGYSGTQSVGARRMDIACEGVVRIADLDIFASVGGYTPMMGSFTTGVTDGSLSLEFRHLANDPAVRGIEVVAVSVAGVLAPSRGDIGFGNVVVGSTSAPEQVTLTNLGQPGDPSIALLGATASAGFAHTLTPQTLAPGQTRTFNVSWSPASSGPATGTLEIAHSGVGSPLTLTLSGTGVPTGVIAFGKSTLAGTSLLHPTSLQFGPDGRLYVAQQDGVLRVYTVRRDGPDQYAVTATETITSIQSIPNHQDDGTPFPALTTRLVTGLLVTGTAAQPVVYVTSSDPRMNVAGDIGLDTNSGILSRLRWNGAAWEKVDLVRGLPRSENDHASNGLALDALTNTLYLAQGGNTNMGAPSNNFSFLPEYALAAAILSIDLDAIGDVTYDLPTLDDEDRPGEPDANDPFGGNDGRNQARLVPGGPVQVHSPGWRNPYDVVFTSAGRLYAVDNGPNAGWGGPPVGEGPGGACTNADNDESSASYADQLHRVTPGFYAGHPNPTRASTSNTFNGTAPQSPVAAGNPVECEYRPPGTDGSLAAWGFSTNGLTEYRGTNFGGAMLGDLLTVSYSNALQRVALDAEGDSARLSETLFSSVGVVPLDVTAQGAGDSLPGTIWVCDYVTGAIVVYEPADFDGGPVTCTGADSSGLDEDGDGYSNADELANGVSPCSAGDLPPDFDHDFLSDRLDPDDDGDGLSDVVDAFALDPANGAVAPPLLYSWDGGDPGTGLFGMGFTGLMTDGVTDYLDRFDPLRITAGGAAGKFTVDAVTAGDARGALGGQQYAFHFGVACDSTTEVFRVHTRVSSPYFGGALPTGERSQGVVIGDGGDDDYLKLVVAGDAGQPLLEVVHEVAGAVDSFRVAVPGLLSHTWLDLVLVVDPAAGSVQPLWFPRDGAPEPVGPPVALVPGSALREAVRGAAPLATGVIATSRGAAPFTATWDFFEVRPVALAGLDPVLAAPAVPHLHPAWPNPAAGPVRLAFELPRAGIARLAVHDVTGARVRVVAEGAFAAGRHDHRWDGRDARGERVPPGVYFSCLDVDGQRLVRRVALVR